MSLTTSDGRDGVYTLLGVRADGVSTVIDLVPSGPPDTVLRTAAALLSEHASCDSVEVWRGSVLIEKLTRA